MRLMGRRKHSILESPERQTYFLNSSLTEIAKKYKFGLIIYSGIDEITSLFIPNLGDRRT
jgi:hypothetical protein